MVSLFLSPPNSALTSPASHCTRGAEDKMLLKMPQKLLKTAHYIELGSYQHWPVLIPQRIRLYTYEQIPLFLKENPYITDGYRAHLPSKLCLRRWESCWKCVLLHTSDVQLSINFATLLKELLSCVVYDFIAYTGMC